MKNYRITIDTGTTNTRVLLWDGQYKLLDELRAAVGVRNSAAAQNNAELKAAVAGCIHGLLQRNHLTAKEIASVVAGGMITSNVGLVEIPHLVTPVDINALANGAQAVLMPDIFPYPVTFIPGVKNNCAEPNLNNLDRLDMMRGEEIEVMALLHHLPKDSDYLLVLPGSHTKFVSVDCSGAITGCLTSMTGELLDCLTNHTILSDTVAKRFTTEDTYDSDMVLLGFDISQKSGLGRAAFSTRILRQLCGIDTDRLPSYLLGVVLQTDLDAVKHSDSIQVCADTHVVIACKAPLLWAIADVFAHDGFFTQISQVPFDAQMPLSGFGALLVAEQIKRQQQE